MNSIASAAIYGIIFSVFVIFVKVIYGQIGIILRLPYEMFFYSGNIRSFSSLEATDVKDKRTPEGKCRDSNNIRSFSSLGATVVEDKSQHEGKRCDSDIGNSLELKAAEKRFFSKQMAANFCRCVLTFIKLLLFFVGVIVTSYYALDGAVRLYFIVISALSALLAHVVLGKIANLLTKFTIIAYKLLVIAVRGVTLPLRFVIIGLARFLWKKLYKIISYVPDRGILTLDKDIK